MNALCLLRGARTSALHGALVALAMGTGCAKLDPIQANVCGNHIVDPGEDCDGSAAGSGTKCAGPTEPGACHFVTTGGAICPSTMRSGTADEICRTPSGTFTPLGAPISGTSGRDPIAIDFDNDGHLDVVLDDPAHNEGFIELLIKGAANGSRAFGKAPTVPLAVGDFMGAGNADVLVAPFAAQSPSSFVALQAPDYFPVALSSNDPGGVFRTVPLQATLAGHPDLNDIGLLTDCLPLADGTPASPLCQLAMLNHGLAIFRVGDATGMPATVLSGAAVWDPAVDGLLDPHPLGNLVTGVRAHVTASAKADDLVLAFRGTSHVRDLVVVPDTCGVASCDTSVCSGTSPNCPPGCAPGCLAESADIALTPTTSCPSPTVEMAIVVDANGDNLSDVLVSARCSAPGKEDKAAVFEFDATGNRSNPFGPQQELGTLEGNGAACTPAVDPTGRAAGPTHVPVLLAAGDIDQDKKLDYVFDSGVSLSASKVSSSSVLDQDLTIPLSAACFSRAVVTDINRDGNLDVVATGPYFHALLFLISNGTSFLTPVARAATDDIDLLAVGDFDGDGTNDVIVSVPPASGNYCTETHNVVAYWGNPLAPPGDATTIGALPAISQLISARMAAADSNDGLSDLGILSDCTLEEAKADIAAYPKSDPRSSQDARAYVRHSAAIFRGSPDRSLVAPYTVRLPPVQALATILAMGVGDVASAGTKPMAETDSNPDVVMLVNAGGAPGVTVSGLAVALLPSTGSGVIATLQPADVVDLKASIDPKSTPAIAALLTDNGHRDIFAAYVQQSKLHLAQVDVTKAPGMQASDLGSVDVPGIVAPRLAIVADDFDRDGKLDIAVVAAPDETKATKSGAIAIWYGTGGTFSAPCTVMSPDGEGFRALTTVDTGGPSGSPIRTAVFATAHEVYAAGAAVTGCMFQPGGGLLGASSKDPSDIVGVAAADFDEDGPEDLVVARSSSLTILAQGTKTLGGATP